MLGKANPKKIGGKPKATAQFLSKIKIENIRHISQLIIRLYHKNPLCKSNLIFRSRYRQLIIAILIRAA